MSTLPRLDQLHKLLLSQKEELLKESKTKQTTMDSVKTQIDGLMKVRCDPTYDLRRFDA